MRHLKRLLRLSILTLVVFSSSSMINESYAYWASNATGNTDTSNSLVTIGTWTFGYEVWDSNTSYTTGDIVTHNGGTYQAKKDGILKEPGVGSWKSDWTQIG